MQFTETIVEMVKAGLGISVLARWAIKPQLEQGQLVAIPISEADLYRTWYAVRLKGSQSPAFLERFAEHLAAHSLQFTDHNS